jgi:hypothetical protein
VTTWSGTVKMRNFTWYHSPDVRWDILTLAKKRGLSSMYIRTISFTTVLNEKPFLDDLQKNSGKYSLSSCRHHSKWVQCVIIGFTIWDGTIRSTADKYSIFRIERIAPIQRLSRMGGVETTSGHSLYLITVCRWTYIS